MFEEEPGGSWAPCLGELRVPQEEVQQHTVEQLADVGPMVQILDIPGPQGKDQLVEACRYLDLPIPEQVIEVPKISSSSRRSRRRRVSLSTQTAEQLVVVPEFVSFSFLFQQQIVDAPGSPHGFLPGQDYLLVWEQIVDVAVPHGHGGWAGRRGFQVPSQEQNSAAFSGVEHVDIPVPCRGGLQGPGKGSTASSSRSPGAADGVFTEFFSQFPRPKKVRSWVRTRGRN